MSHVRFVPLVVRAVALSGSIVSAAPVTQAAATPQQPTVPYEAFRVDPATGALTPLESTKARKVGSGQVYCYLEGARSPVTIRQGEPLVFAGRFDGSPKFLESLRKLSGPLYKLEILFVSDGERRYATKKFVPMDGGPYGEVVSGVDPKRQKDVGQSFVFKPLGQLPPGEYALTVGGILVGSYPYPDCAKVVSAFRVVEGVPLTQRTSLPSPSPQSSPAPTNSAADIEGLRRAAEHGDVVAQISLAQAYATGSGVPQDYQQTHQWLRKAADQGSAEAQYWLGVMYRDAVGVAPDQAQTAQLFRMAAEQGHPQAQGNLGNLHFFGRGVVQDYVEAHKWLNIAGTRLEGDDRKQCVELRDKVAGLMTPVQMAEAQKRAVDWIEAFQKRKPK